MEVGLILLGIGIFAFLAGRLSIRSWRRSGGGSLVIRGRRVQFEGWQINTILGRLSPDDQHLASQAVLGQLSPPQQAQLAAALEDAAVEWLRHNPKWIKRLNLDDVL